jgi:ABC-type dipeptide/oligopeptide/nickel transport system ATPase component
MPTAARHHQRGGRFLLQGQTQELDVQLQQAETDHVVTITSTQISQEADLGSQATYDLLLERSSVDVRRFQLKVLNLPHQIGYSFIDLTSQARLSQLSFPSGVTQQTLSLRLFLPERADEPMRIDQPLEFWATVTDQPQAQRFQPERRYSPNEIEQSRAGRVRLTIIPRGKKNRKKDHYYAVMREVGLPEKAFEQRVKTFSKGMRQKLGMAICMVKDAPALLLDEPTAGLDPKAAAEFLETLNERRQGGKAILMSTHDIFRAKEIADRVGIMKEGRKVMERTREDLEHEDLEQLYLDYMRGRLESEHA